MVNTEKTKFNVFRGASPKRLCHYIPSTSHEDELDVVLLHIGSYDINNQRNDKINTEKLTEGIINISSSCINLGVKEVTISSILPKNNIALTLLYVR